MRLSTPRWWYRREGAPGFVTRMVLRPVSWIWAAITARRIATTEPVRVAAKVICVGNLTVGGTGKTPVVRELLRILTAEGVGCAALTRGYGGADPGPTRVSPAVHDAREVGDEPLMLARDYPVWIARDRVAGARAASAEVGALVMDDGHHNPSLAKDLSLVVIDGETRDDEWPFGDGAVFPSGPMREPLAVGLARADAVVMMLPADLADADPKLLQVFGDTPVMIARLRPDGPPPSGRQLAFAGVGKPWKVERALKAAGCDLADFVSFGDHQAYDEGVLNALARQAETLGAGLLTTEKDWVRLPPAWQRRIAAWPVRATFEDEAALTALLRRTIMASRSESDPAADPR